jgi:hypothetical protein
MSETLNNAHGNQPSGSSSLFRLPAKIVQRKVAGIVIAQLERHYEQLLPELRKEVEAIIKRELDERVGELIDREFSARIEAAIDRRWTTRAQADQVLRDRFTRVFYENLWLDPESVSGPGSRRDSPCVLQSITALHVAREKTNFVSMNDIPCGDFNWIDMFLKGVPDVRYRGFDIVPGLIERNQFLHAEYEFDVLDITSTPPPYADLIFSKDLLNHLTYEDIRSALINMKKSDSVYLLVTNNFGHINIELGANAGNASRHFDLCAEPFNFPQPIWRDDYIGLWRFSEINL